MHGTLNGSNGVVKRMLLRWRRWLSVLGPGVMVMLADNDVGSVVTVTQSGAHWGYRLLLLQVLLIPVLVMVQELAARLGLATGKGLGELVRLRLGRSMVALSSFSLLLSCFGALVTQLSGMAGIGQLYGLPLAWAASLPVVLALAMFMTGTYRSVERVALVCGVLGFAFLIVAWKAHPDPSQLAAQFWHIPWGNREYLYLVAANIGTSIMPWTVFYQQSALVDQGLDESDLRAARVDTWVGAVACQLITAGVLVAAAASLGNGISAEALDSIGGIAQAFTATLGETVGHSVFSIGLMGCATVALIVVCLTAAWAVGEAMGRRHSLEHHPSEAPAFYIVFAVMLVGAGALVASGLDLVLVATFTGVLNALLLPVVLWVLLRLARTELPAGLRLSPSYAVVVTVVFVLTAGVGVVSGVVGLFH